VKNRRPEVYIDKINYLLHVFLALYAINVIRLTERFHDIIITFIRIHSSFEKLWFPIDYAHK